MSAGSLQTLKPRARPVRGWGGGQWMVHGQDLQAIDVTLDAAMALYYKCTLYNQMQGVDGHRIMSAEV